MEKWSKLEDSLIDQVREHPILYRSNSKSYKHMLVKENTWKDIAASLSLTRRECKLKWKGIRDGYRRSRIMEMKGRAGRKSKYNDDRLQFLADARRDSETVKQEPLESTPSAAPEVPPPEAVSHEEPYERRVLLEELRKGREERYELLRLLSSVSVQQAAATESATHSFFRSMADIVAQLPPHRVAEVRVRVCGLVTEAEMQAMGDCSPAEQLELVLHAPARAPCSADSPEPSAKKR